MPKRRNLTIEKRSSVVTLCDEGYSQRNIAKKLKISLCAVQSILKKKRETGTVADRPRSGRPRATTNRVDRSLVRLSLSDRRASSKILKSQLQDVTGSSLSTRSIRRRLLKAGLKGCVAAKKPMLTARHKKLRLKWAKERRQWEQSEWSKILWSDESIFELIPGRRAIVRRRVGERFHPDCIVSTVKHGGGKIHVWGCMARDGVGSLLIVDGRLTASAYIDLISPTLKEDGERLIGSNFIFQQDGARCHTARYSMEWFSSNRINVLQWTPQSADLNPIEHLWEEIKRRMDQKPCRNASELKELVIATWRSITPDITANLVDSMSRRCQAVIAARSGPTKY